MFWFTVCAEGKQVRRAVRSQAEDVSLYLWRPETSHFADASCRLYMALHWLACYSCSTEDINAVLSLLFPADIGGMCS